MAQEPQPDSLIFRILRKIYGACSLADRAKLHRHANRDFEAVGYLRLRELGMRPATVIDVGAYQGDWSRGIRALFPEARIMMFEAQPGMAEALGTVARTLGNAEVFSALLASEPGLEKTFHIMGTGSSFRRENSNVAAEQAVLTSSTLDEILPGDIARPLFLKIDTQGAELDILKGGQATLAKADYVQLEVALLEYNQGAPLLAEVLQFMRERDFLATDITGITQPVDRTVQIDLLFTRTDSPLRPTTFRFG